ncbi:hypothetical protein ACCO45_012313 [Purpureocillium lilacinum]|uniref:Uncharacterized protein n=1 Tax=Purpureocillium lilacinum TaxID=33203 RepID=A0ACC4DAP5_PURLI
MDTTALELFFASQWTSITERSKSSLDPDDLEMVEQFRTWTDAQRYVLNEQLPSITLLGPALGHLETFAQVFGTQLGRNLDVSFLWGSLTRLLQSWLISSSFVLRILETLGKVPRMVKSLAHKAEAFNGYCKNNQAVDDPAKEACFDMQILFIEFFTASINFIHGAGDLERHRISNDPYPGDGDTPFRLIEQRYTVTNQELGEALIRVEKLARVKSSSWAQSSKRININTTEKITRCLMLPQTRTTRCFNREDVFDKLDEFLEPAAEQSSLRSVALHGLGGVGKSTVASTYVEKKFEDHIWDVILWVRGEKLSSLRQSFTDVAMRLKLPGAQPQTHDENLILVQDWFQSTGKLWSNPCFQIQMLMPFWPGSNHGHAIITTRNHSLAFEPASDGLEVLSWDAKTGSQFLLFLLKNNIGRDLEAEGTSALALSERLSGHALALSHMAGIIHDGELSIQEFMTIYLKNTRRAHATNELLALWEFSFKSLDQNSRTLLALMSFLMPDIIPQEIFEASTENSVPDHLRLCLDEFSLSAAIRKLITLALVKKNRNTKVLSVHRMVQTQFKHFLSVEERQKNFNDTVALVYNVFPREDVAKGQLYDAWETCNKYLQHVLNLRDCFTEEKTLSASFRATGQFCDLLIQCQRYLYETNALEDLGLLCEVNLAAVNSLVNSPQKDDMRASIMSHQANLAESLGDAQAAIELNKNAYEIRLHERPMKQQLLCYISNNVGYCYNTANDHKNSLEWFQKSQVWWTASVRDRSETQECPAFILKNTARCLVYLDDFEGAAKLLDVAISRLKTERPLNWAMLA